MTTFLRLKIGLLRFLAEFLNTGLGLWGSLWRHKSEDMQFLLTVELEWNEGTEWGKDPDDRNQGKQGKCEWKPTLRHPNEGHLVTPNAADRRWRENVTSDLWPECRWPWTRAGQRERARNWFHAWPKWAADRDTSHDSGHRRRLQHVHCSVNSL